MQPKRIHNTLCANIKTDSANLNKNHSFRSCLRAACTCTLCALCGGIRSFHFGMLFDYMNLPLCTSAVHVIPQSISLIQTRKFIGENQPTMKSFPKIFGFPIDSTTSQFDQHLKTTINTLNEFMTTDVPLENTGLLRFQRSSKAPATQTFRYEELNISPMSEIMRLILPSGKRCNVDENYSKMMLSNSWHHSIVSNT